MGDGMVFIGGEYVAPEDAKISIFDNGFVKSDVVYDVTSTWKGQFFRLDDHMERFLRSCAGVNVRGRPLPLRSIKAPAPPACARPAPCTPSRDATRTTSRTVSFPRIP